MLGTLRIATMLLPAVLASGFFLAYGRRSNRRLLFFVTSLLAMFGLEALVVTLLVGLISIPLVLGDYIRRENFGNWILMGRAVFLLVLGMPFLFWLKKVFPSAP
jgi:hypothetical protein